MIRTHPTPRRRAFTLIELLVVIAVIGILISIATPAIVKANNLAQEAKCLTNVRSIGQSTLAYTNDFDGNFPHATGVNLRHHNLLGKAGELPGPGGNMRRLAAEDRLLYSYLGQNVDVGECPLDRGWIQATNGVERQSAYDYFGSSYVYVDSNRNNLNTGNNNHASNRLETFNGIWSLEGHRLSRVDAPSKKIIVADANIVRTADSPAHEWHNVGSPLEGSMVFVDGSAKVQPYKISQTINTTTGTNAGRVSINSAQLRDLASQDEYY